MSELLTADDPEELTLANEVYEWRQDPLRCVLGGYPWGKPGPLERFEGPDEWQWDFLERLGRHVRERDFDGHTPVSPIRMAVSSGHGVGKSTLGAWLVLWIMATRPNSQGTITANTRTQLSTKTWAAVEKWAQLFSAGKWFEVSKTIMRHRSEKLGSTWFCAPASCREENSEAFAGQHAAEATSFYLFDESSSVPDGIHQVAEGGLTDGEPMIFLFGNPTRSTGRFHRACFGSARARWDTVVVDSRQARFTNKDLIAEWAQDHGEDSDFFRVRVRGLPPSASELQFIDLARVSAAQKRGVETLTDDPLVCGLDVARGGSDYCVFRFRRGADARSVPPVRIPGEEARDSNLLVAKAATLLDSEFLGRKIDMLFVDGTGIGGPIADRLKQLGYEKRVTEVQFGGHSPDPKCANMRAYIWSRVREWLTHGAIDDSPVLEQDLTGPDIDHDSRDRLVLESKKNMVKRGLASPDDGDALALTFAAPVGLPRPKRKASRHQAVGWMG